MKGAIGALDGWLVRIQRPSFYWDGMTNITTFYSRKGFYALNVQVIVDDKKRVLWVSYSHKGGSHDSSCFRATKLYEFLKKISGKLLDNGYFILGDSAYCIKSFLLPPYDNAEPRSQEDDFNFYHSSARITVECAFGEIDLRWGIFWKRLNYNLENSSIIIEGAMRLHNFLVDYRESRIEPNLEAQERILFQEDIINSLAVPIQIGNDLGRPQGNITNDERMDRLKGMAIRDCLSQNLADVDMHRKINHWKCDTFTHTYNRLDE